MKNEHIEFDELYRLAEIEVQGEIYSEEEKKELEGELEIVTNANEQTYNAVNEILEQFMKENPGVKISYTTQGSDYEQLMKARMASNDLPDMFWLTPYAQLQQFEKNGYLMDLSDHDLT